MAAIANWKTAVYGVGTVALTSVEIVLSTLALVIDVTT
jgi:hypothetical protein